MNSEQKTTVVDFIAKGDSTDTWKMVLVEQGPWPGSLNEQLRRIQDRMYGCIDAALDGQLSERFPETKDKNIIIQLDCYNVPRAEVEEFFSRFASGVFALDDYRSALSNNRFVKSIDFEVSFDSIH